MRTARPKCASGLLWAVATGELTSGLVALRAGAAHRPFARISVGSLRWSDFSEVLYGTAMTSTPGSASLVKVDDVLITAVLAERKPRAKDLESENRALGL